MVNASALPRELSQSFLKLTMFRSLLTQEKVNK
jgi:hypothetical protein